MCVSMRLVVRCAVDGLCGRAAAHYRAYAATVMRLEVSTYVPVCLLASTVTKYRWASTLFLKDFLR